MDILLINLDIFHYLNVLAVMLMCKDFYQSKGLDKESEYLGMSIKDGRQIHGKTFHYNLLYYRNSLNFIWVSYLSIDNYNI